MKKWNKIVAIVSALAVTAAMMLTVTAANASDYTACKYGKVADAGTDTVKVSGKGYLGTTAAQGVNAASAAMFNRQVDTRNIKFTLNFLEDYGKGEGSQAGWYAFNLSATKDWFSSVKAVIAKSNVKGVVVIFKLNPNSKKDLIIELSRYTPGSGFSNIFGQSIEIKMKNDWKCDVEIANGKLTIDGNSIIDLSESLDLTVGSGKGYIGFGGFSENHYDVAMNVTMKTESGSVSSSTASSKPATSSSTSKPQAGTSSKVSSTAIASENNITVVSNASTQESTLTSEPVDSDVASTVESDEESTVISDSSELPQAESTGSTATAGANEKKNNVGLIVGIVIAVAVVIGAGVAGLLIYRKKKTN